MSIVNRIFNGSLGITQTFLLDPWSAAAAAFGSVVNAATQNRNTDKAIAAQREENERAYQRNIEQWERENDYNTPTAVAQRLRDAGMNPALAYGTPNVSSPSPTLNPTDVSALANKRSVFGTALESPLNQELIQAQIGVLKSEENKNNAAADLTDSQKTTQDTYNSFQNALLKGELQEQDARINLNWSQSELNDAHKWLSYRQSDELLANIRRINQEVDNMQREYEILGEDLAIKQIIHSYQDATCQATLKEMYAAANQMNANAKLTFEEFEQLVAQEQYNLAIKKTTSENLFQTGMNIKKEGDILDLSWSMMEYDREHYSGQRVIDNGVKIIQGVASLVGSTRSAAVPQSYTETSRTSKGETIVRDRKYHE